LQEDPPFEKSPQEEFQQTIPLKEAPMIKEPLPEPKSQDIFRGGIFSLVKVCTLFYEGM
jgi:hypothetical protein